MDKENALPTGISRNRVNGVQRIGAVATRSVNVPRFDEPVKTPSLDSSVLTNRSSSFYANLSKRIKSKKDVGSVGTVLGKSNGVTSTKLLGERNVNISKNDDSSIAVKALNSNTGNNTGNYSDWTRKLSSKDFQGQRLLSKIIQHVNDPEKKIILLCWKEFLDYIQSKPDIYPRKSLVEWFDRAIELLPSNDLRKDPLYVDIALKWAMLQADDDIKESKIRLKWIVANRIGLDDARTYISRAKIDFEISGASKARKTIEEGISRGAEPLDLLLQEITKISDWKKSDVRFNDSVLSDIDISVKSITYDMRNSIGTHVGTETGSDQSNQVFRESQDQLGFFSKESSNSSKNIPPPANSISESLKRLLFEEEEEDRLSQEYVKTAPKVGNQDMNEFKSPSNVVDASSLKSKSSKTSQVVKITPEPEGAPKRTPKLDSQIPLEEKHVRFDTGDSISRKSSPVSKPASAGPNQVFVINGKTYHKLEIVGKGGSGKVYKVIGEDLKIYALKRVKFNPEDNRSVESYKNEINLLRSLKDKANIIQMYDCSEDYESGILYMVRF
jgi:hypothetical protein